jgi:hypothetical protein
MKKTCTREEPSEFEGRYQVDCDLIPDLRNWYLYPYGGGIEIDGVLVNPKDQARSPSRLTAASSWWPAKSTTMTRASRGKRRPCCRLPCKARVLNGDDQDQCRLSSPFAEPPHQAG